PIVQALFFELKAAVLAVVLEAVVRVGKRALKSPALIAIAALAFVAIFAFSVPFPAIVLAAALIGYLGKFARREWFKSSGGHDSTNSETGPPAYIDVIFDVSVPQHVR